MTFLKIIVDGLNITTTFAFFFLCHHPLILLILAELCFTFLLLCALSSCFPISALAPSPCTVLPFLLPFTPLFPVLLLSLVPAPLAVSSEHSTYAQAQDEMGSELGPRGPDQADTQQPGFKGCHDILWVLSHFMIVSAGLE